LRGYVIPVTAPGGARASSRQLPFAVMQGRRGEARRPRARQAGV